MPQDAEAEASDNCVLYWLSTRLDIQTVNLATASLPTHTCFTILLLFDCKIFSVISGGFVQVRCIASERHYCTDTARIPCDRQPTMSLSETDTSDNCLYCCLAVPLSGFGNVRVMPFCPPIPPLPLINCFTISLLLYKRQFLSTQAY
jgi:hypothetical protein